MFTGTEKDCTSSSWNRNFLYRQLFRKPESGLYGKTCGQWKRNFKWRELYPSGNAPSGYIDIPLDRPADGVTPAGEKYSYSPNDASIGDVDGDGNYEIILKWDPSNAHDNAHDGYTGNVYFDCYRLTGENYGASIWERTYVPALTTLNSWYMTWMETEKAEIVMKTSDGTIDGKGKVIGDATADYREPGDPNQPKGGDFSRMIHETKESLPILFVTRDVYWLEMNTWLFSTDWQARPCKPLTIFHYVAIWKAGETSVPTVVTVFWHALLTWTEFILA